jgi:hypothetical protein
MVQKITLITLLMALFLGCSEKDDYFTQTYNSKLKNEPISCLKLSLSPYSEQMDQLSKRLFPFDDQ